MPERYLSPAMHDQDALSLISAPLVGIEARIYNNLWNAVIDRALRPGTKLEEAALCEIYGVSRTVVRKVLVIMEQEGIVSLPLNRGAYVALPSPRDARELCEVVVMMATHLITGLASRSQDIKPEQRHKLEIHVQAEIEASRNGDYHTARRLRIEHGTLLSLIYGNHILAASFERHLSRLALALSAYQRSPVPNGGVEYTSALNQSILAGDPAAAVNVFLDFMDAVQKSMDFAEEAGAVDLRAILGGQS